MSEKKHDPEDRSSSDWLDGLFRMSGRTWEEVKAERRDQETSRSQPKRLPPKRPEDWVRPDQVTPDDDGNVTITIRPRPVEEERTIPPAPEGVVVHLVNGEKQVVEVVWVGTSLTGIQIWEVTSRYRFDEIKRVTIEVLPAGTQVHIGGSGGP